jgi:hypothetical protein
MSWVTFSDRIASLAAILLTLIAIFYPLLVSFLVFKNTRRLDEESYRQKCGALYEEIKTYSRPALSYNVLFILRRLFIAGMCIFLANYVFL